MIGKAGTRINAFIRVALMRKKLYYNWTSWHDIDATMTTITNINTNKISREETKMRNHNWRQAVYLVCLIAALTVVGCKKRVAAAPSAPSPVQPAPPTPAPAITLRATPAAIDRGQTTSLQWEAKNATSVSIQPELGSVQAQGSRSVRPNSSVTYTAVAMGPGGSASDSARITVRVPAAAAPPRSEPPRTDARVNMADLFRQNVQTVYFDFDKSDLRPDQASRVATDASWLKEHPGLKFTIEGDCDARGSEEYNLGLGDRRANRVKEALIKDGVDPSSINTISYGKERPVCREANEECYQKNRRAAFTPSPTS
jgi:peptidoglycan-associated lipoprotein